MATITSVGSGLWSAAGTWDTGVPVDGDTVVIASEHTVTLDIDQSSYTTGHKLAVSGTLTHSTTTNSYFKGWVSIASNAYTGSGFYIMGTAENPIPNGVTAVFSGGGGRHNNAWKRTTYGAEPSYKWVRVTGTSGKTIYVDTDVTGDIWSVGNTVGLIPLSTPTAARQKTTIATGGIASNSITVVDTISPTLDTGSYVVLLTRNVQIIAGTYGSLETGSSNDINNTWFPAGSLSSISTSNVVLNKCVLTGGATQFASTGLQMHDSIGISGSDGTWTSHSRVVKAIFDNCYFFGSPQTLFVYSYNVIFNTCHFIGCNTVVSYSNDITFLSCVAEDCSQLSLDSVGYSYNTLMDVSQEVSMSDTYSHPYSSFVSSAHDQVDGTIKIWSLGGVIINETTIVPSGYTSGYKAVLSSASYNAFGIFCIKVDSGTTISINVAIRKDTSMTYLPRIYLTNNLANPLINSSDVLDSFVITDSIDTWETDTLSITNSTDYDQEYKLWFVAKNASGNAYSAYDITTEGGTGGGGAVSIQPLSGRISL